MTKFGADVSTELTGARDIARRLVVVYNGGSVVRDLPAAGALALGRSDDADIRIDHPSVSRRHALLVVSDVVRINDLGSANGTWVDGKRLPSGGNANVAAGALIEVGSALLLV